MEKGKILITSRERSTGMGASHSSRVLMPDGTWSRLSEVKAAVHEGREDGYQVYTLEVEGNQVWATFDRSNSGLEEVHIYQEGKEIAHFLSFEKAEIWAKKVANAH